MPTLNILCLEAVAVLIRHNNRFVFEKVIHNRLLDYLNITDAIPKSEFGFKSNHSTVQQLLRIMKHINSAFEMHSHTGAIFIDILKAFDKVWHEGLFFELRSINTPTYLFNVIWSFLSDRQYSVRRNDSASNLKSILAGVLQGSKLSPILFNHCVSDISQSPRTHIVVFADDTIIFIELRNIEAITTNLQAHLNTLQRRCKSWRIKINASKSIVLILSLLRYSNHPELNFNN